MQTIDFSDDAQLGVIQAQPCSNPDYIDGIAALLPWQKLTGTSLIDNGDVFAFQTLADDRSHLIFDNGNGVKRFVPIAPWNEHGYTPINLKRLLKKHGMTYADCAEALGLSVNGVERWANENKGFRSMDHGKWKELLAFVENNT